MYFCGFEMRLYFTTSNKLTFYPDTFVTSKAKKKVYVLNATLVYEDPNQFDEEIRVVYPVHFAQLHASFVHDSDDLMDNYVCECNKQYPHIKCFEQANNDDHFTIWFTDYAQREIQLTENHHFVVELMLQY